MRISLILLIVFVVSMQGHGQALVIPASVTYSHSDDCLTDEASNDSVLAIQMENGFADTLKFVVDGKVVQQGYFRSDFMQTTHQVIYIPRRSSSLDISCGNSGVHILLSQDYRYLAINRVNGMWLLTYSDCAVVHE